MSTAMKTTVLLVALAAGMFGAASSVFAQDSPDVVFADVPFAFTFAGKVLQPGRYEVIVANPEQTQVELVSPAEKGVMGLVMTRLAASEARVADARLVFDEVGTTKYLSEMWLPGRGRDGYLLYAAKEPHTHKTVTLQHRAKSTT